MTGRPAPTPPRTGRAASDASGPWPPADLPGLWVNCGNWHYQRRVWLRLPTARFTCLHGCERSAVGAADVTEFTKTINAVHARTCPGPSNPL
ncbi:hypothetical protein [Streptomyces sp. 049-1]|uniref:hypothetical protein n=1 Tax=Streptomyces sp. 049-1 TaxID=2789264 RepID=UPI003980D16C